MIEGVLREVLRSDSVTKVIVALGNWYRIDSPQGVIDPEWAFFNKGFGLKNEYMTWLINSPFVEKNYHFHVNYCDHFQWFISDEKVRRYSIDRILFSLFKLYEICKQKGVDVEIFQLLKPIRKNDPEIAKSFVSEVVENEWFQKLDKIEKTDSFKLLGWPFFDDLGGDHAQQILTDEMKIGKLDSHPNQKGHEALGKWFNEYESRTRLKLVPYISDGVRVEENEDICHEAFLQMQQESSSDRLAFNYRFDQLNLPSMRFFNFMFDGDEPVQASGCQVMSENVVRVCSRYYLFDDFRTDSSDPLNKVDDFFELEYVLERLKDVPLLIWSREKAPSFFRRIKAAKPELFSDWKVHDTKIELLYENNFQNIFYVGDISFLDEVTHPTI